MFHWEKAAVAFVRRNRAVLAAKPVWLFSSGPLGSEAVDAQGRDQRLAAIPKEAAEMLEAVDAREHRVFFGAYERDRKPIGIAERLVSIMPAAREAMPEGDFRDWPEIEAWAAGIAADLTQAPAG
jgi:menaquinone-dependent protoporphyrinogen oxidase